MVSCHYLPFSTFASRCRSGNHTRHWGGGSDMRVSKKAFKVTFFCSNKQARGKNSNQWYQNDFLSLVFIDTEVLRNKEVKPWIINFYSEDKKWHGQRFYKQKTKFLVVLMSIGSCHHVFLCCYQVLAHFRKVVPPKTLSEYSNFLICSYYYIPWVLHNTQKPLPIIEWLILRISLLTFLEKKIWNNF